MKASGPRRPRRGGGRRFVRARKSCRFCGDKVDYIDYKDSRLFQLRSGAGQDSTEANLGDLFAASANAGHGD